MHVRASVLGILNPNYEFLPFIFIILAPFYVPNCVIDSVIMYTYIMKNVILMILLSCFFYSIFGGIK